MVTCAVSSTRVVVNSSRRIGKSRAVPSAQFTYAASLQASARDFCARSTMTSASLPHNVAPPKAFAPLSARSLKGRETRTLSLFLSSTMLACAFGFVTATTSTESNTLPSTSSSKSKFSPNGGNNGGGGSSKPLGSVLSNRKNAEEDIRQLEEEAANNPYEVSFAFYCETYRKRLQLIR